MEVKDLIKEYLERARLMQIATCKDNQPWACTVYFAYDEDFNLYWISKPDTRHSKELGENEKVAGTIVLPHTPGSNVRGLQFEGLAKKAKRTDGLDIYAKRMNMKDARKQSIKEGTDGHDVYKIKPTMFVLFDTENFPNNPRQEYML